MEVAENPSTQGPNEVPIGLGLDSGRHSLAPRKGSEVLLSSFFGCLGSWVLGYFSRVWKARALHPWLLRVSLGVWVVRCLGIPSLAEPAPIPEARITALQQQLAEVTQSGSSVATRRACKSLIREAESLLDSSPDAPNRYAFLAIIFEAQKRLLSLEATEANREAIFETCSKLLEAPAEYTETRFEADMLLSERDLAAAEASVKQRAKALEAMLAKYRGTAAEWKSLVMGSLIATKLLEFDLDKKIRDTMSERFAGDHKVIDYQRKSQPGSQIDAVFSGTYKKADGSSVAFPYDRSGHQYLVYFWSRGTPDIDKHLGAIKALQDRQSGLQVFSFNLDDLPDAGLEKLRSLGLDWSTLYLPGGREHSAYRAYAQTDPHAVLVNGQGHVLLSPPPPSRDFHGRQIQKVEVFGSRNLPQIEERLDNSRYLTHLQYLFTGDFLVADTPRSESIPAATLQPIQACFVAPPFRYRLTSEEALANYRQASKLCADAIDGYRDSADLVFVRNRRIVALLGMWNLAQEPGHLEEAVAEANAVIALDVPPEADVVARFCLARQALRDGGVDPEALVAQVIGQLGGENAPPSALAAAAILTLEANARTAHEEYRRRLLEVEAEADPRLWPVLALLRDRHHRYRNFYASPGGHGYGRPQKYEFRHMMTGLAEPVDRSRALELEVESLDAGPISIPGKYAGKMLGVIFAEPPIDPRARNGLAQRVNDFAKMYTRQDVAAMAVWLSDERDVVRSLIADDDAGFETGILPGGLKNPIVRQFGILSADRIPNLFLLRPDGTIAWHVSGIRYQAFRSGPEYAIGLAIGMNIEKVRSDAAFDTLAKGDFKRAIELFDAFRPADERSDYWAADRLQGKALAYMGMEDLEAALIQIDAAIARRRNDFKSSMCKCHGVVEMHLTKAMILERLGRTREAKLERSKAEKENLPHAKLPPGLARQGVPVGVYYNWLKQIRLEMSK